MRFRDYMHSRTDSSKLLFFSGIALLSMTLLSLLAGLCLPYFFGDDVAKILYNPDVFSVSKAIPALRLMQVIQSTALFIIPAFLFAFILYARPFEWLGFKTGNRLILQIGLGVLFIISMQPMINWMAEANRLIPVSDWMIEAEKQAELLTRAFLKMGDKVDLIINVLVIGFLPAFAEELFFRGALYRLFSGVSKSENASVWITAFIFSALHMQFLGFIPRFVLGITLGYMRKWSGSLWLPIVVHAFNNSMAVILHYGTQHAWWTEEVEMVGNERSDSWVVIAGGFVATWCLQMIWRNSKPSSDPSIN